MQNDYSTNNLAIDEFIILRKLDFKYGDLFAAWIAEN